MKKNFASVAACSIVARHLIATIVEDNLSENAWSSIYPEISEEDWKEIVASVKRQAVFPDGFSYNEARLILKERTKKGWD